MAGGWCGCKSESEPAPVPPRPVYSFTVEEPSAQRVRRFSGQLKAAEGAGIAFEVAGRVVGVMAKAGTRYGEGEPLARIDETDFRNQLNDAQAKLINTQQDLRRLQRLFETGNASQSQLDGAIAQEKSALANFNLARKAMDDCTLRMPYDGVIGRVEVEPQQVVNAGQSVMNIQGENGMEFEIGVPAENVGALQAGTEALITLGSLPGREFPATVTEISPQVADNTTYPVTLILAGAGGEDAQLRPGLDGEAALILPNRNGATIRVPSPSVAAAPGGRKYVWILNPEVGTTLARVTRRDVTSGALSGEGMIEITAGLKPGDRVVTRGVHHLEEGMTVSVLD